MAVEVGRHELLAAHGLGLLSLGVLHAHTCHPRTKCLRLATELAVRTRAADASVGCTSAAARCVAVATRGPTTGNTGNTSNTATATDAKLA